MSVIVVFQRETMLSPGVWVSMLNATETTRDLIRAAVPHLKRDYAYFSAARFCGCCHAWIDGNRGLLLLDAPEDGDSLDFQIYRNLNGNPHLYVVCIESGQVSGFGGAKSFTIDNFEKVCPT